MRAARAGENGPVASDARTVVVALSVSQALSFLMSLLAIRTLPVASYGNLISLQTLVMFFALVIDFGQNSSLVRDVAKDQLNHGTVRRILILKSATSLPLITVLVVTRHPWQVSFAAGVWLTMSVLSATVQAEARGKLLIRRYAVSLVAEKAVALVCFGVSEAIWSPGQSLFFVSLGIGSFFSFVVCRSRSKSQNLRDAMEHSDFSASLKNHLRRTKPFAVFVCCIALQGLDVFLVHTFSGSREAAIYGIASRAMLPLTLVATGFAQAAAPHFSRAASHKVAIAQLREFRTPGLLALAVVLATVVTSSRLVPLVFGPQYARSAWVLNIIALAMLPAMANQLLASLLQSRGAPAIVSRIVALGIGCQLFMICILTPSLGARGGAIGWLIGQLLIFLMLMMAIRQRILSKTS